MRIHYLMFTLVLAQPKIQRKYCEVYGDDPAGQCFVKESLITMVHSPHQLAIDKRTDTLYFSFDSGQGEYIPALYKLGTKELTVIKGVKDAYAIAYDQINNEMYFGGTHGIYKFNAMQKSLKRLNINNLDIWWLFVKNDIYFIKFPSLNTYTYQNATIKPIYELTNNVVHQMVMDLDNNKFFINNSGLYGVTAIGNEVILMRDSPRFLNMATDNEGYVYVCSEDGVYIVSKIVQKVKKIANVRGVLGFTFDKFNNIIYSDSHEIVKLLPVNKIR